MGSLERRIEKLESDNSLGADGRDPDLVEWLRSLQETMRPGQSFNVESVPCGIAASAYIGQFYESVANRTRGLPCEQTRTVRTDDGNPG